MIQTAQAIGTSFGKIILIGEHSVVYGAPAIAIPFKAVKSRVLVSNAQKGVYIYCDLYEGLVEDMPKFLDSLRYMIYTTLYYLNKQQAALHIKIDSTIPIERGMGSSAAVCVSIVRALFNFFQIPLDKETLTQLVNLSEKMVHGNPSGVDAAIIINERSLLFKKQVFSKEIDVTLPGYLIVADTGKTGCTKQALDSVATLKETMPLRHQSIMQTLELLTLKTLDAINKKHLQTIGECFTKAHEQLHDLGVSHPLLDTLVQTALNNGALGAKLTGGGLGGCMIALADTKENAEKIANSLKKAGATQIFIDDLNETNA